MAKKKVEEVKEKEELKEEAVTETTEKVEELTTTGETEVELAGDKIEAPLNEDAKVQATENKVPTVKEVFRDKYDEKVIYNVGDVFIEDETLQDNKPIKAEKGKYKVSKERYEELKRSLYVD